MTSPTSLVPSSMREHSTSTKSTCNWLTIPPQSSLAEMPTAKKDGYRAHCRSSSDPKHRLMAEEIFGPIASIYVYDDAEFSNSQIADETSPYALTGGYFLY